MSKKSPREITLEEWKQAVWDYLLEHSDIADGGTLFVKFHTPTKAAFERRIKARVNGYHRRDTRLNMDTREKEQLHLERTKVRLKTKKTKREQWKADQEERKRLLKQVAEQNRINAVVRRYPKPIQPVVHRCILIHATARTKVLLYIHRLSTRLISPISREKAGNGK